MIINLPATLTLDSRQSRRSWAQPDRF